MADLGAVWSQELPEMKRHVSGVGVWQALNAAVPLALEDGVLVLGMPHELSELTGHLRMAQTRRSIETQMSKALGQQITLRVIDGATLADWESAKLRDAEAERLKQIAAARVRQEVEARISWEAAHENLNRKFAGMPMKSLPQNRAKFFWEAIYMVAEARRANPGNDELTERNFARCLERVAQYAEVPGTIVAMHVLELLNDGS
jgi:hypothetical protein